MMIGLTGPNAAGKGAVARYLMKKGFTYLSLSDVLREELKVRGFDIDRESLIRMGNELREKEGPGILAARILERVLPDRPYIIDSIRHPAEAETLKRKSGFFLIVVDAPTEVRFERIRGRKREKDPTTFEAFEQLEARELAGSEDDHQQLGRTMVLADYVIDNNGTLEDLRDKVDRMVKELKGRCSG